VVEDVFACPKKSLKAFLAMEHRGESEVELDGFEDGWLVEADEGSR